MFLFIFEDGKIKKSGSELKVGDLQDCKDGFVSIIDISDPQSPKELNEDKWVLIEGAE